MVLDHEAVQRVVQTKEGVIVDVLREQKDTSGFFT